MRGGLERWKRGASSHGVRQAIAYAFDGTCDAHLSTGATAAAAYSASEQMVTRFSLDTGRLHVDELGVDALAAWIDGRDPLTGEPRGRVLTSPDADLLLDGTINGPKSFSIAALLHPELAAEFEALQDRLRNRVIRAWATELNARRGAGGAFREKLTRVEVVELKHRRSRALDPHVHRHLWLSVKVRGEDGKWSNVDSRVAMRFHTVVNAEGELAARTDPQWVAAPARHGYTIDDGGEIRQLLPAVKPLSRRSNQIEANRAMLLAQWREDHPGLEPSSDALRAIDRRAWALGRPNKPQALDEEDWERVILRELREIDPRIADARSPLTVPLVRELDVDLLAAQAVVDADERSTGYGGRFSVFDIRAGAIRAVAASGVVNQRGALNGLIDEVAGRALAHVRGLLDGAAGQPQHVKSLMAPDTWRLKARIAHALDQLTAPGVRPDLTEVANVADRVLRQDVRLSERQVAAASAIGGIDRLVSVTGPAGSGKTAMLRVARALLDPQRRRMILVAPTKKAASVAARETGCQTASVHALLFDHGWRWVTGRTGAQEWTRVHPGDTDPLTHTPYPGPRRHDIRPGDRIVIDEAGMVDLHAANALLTLAQETGAGIAMVGDHLQAAPVGHAGAMAALTRRATVVVELNTVHRFADPAYGQLTLRLREPASLDQALDVAAELDDGGHLLRVETRDAARAATVNRYFEWASRHRRIALVTASNDEADAINDAIQQHRIDAGELDPTVLALGADEQRILVGDTVQTRRNDSATDVENRATWQVHAIGPQAISLVSVTDPSVVRTIGVEYAAEHLRLAYASTVHGAQGETTDASVVGPDVDAAGLYVGMTRGRIHNEAIVVATNARSARARLAEAMRRGLPEVSVEESQHAAATDLRRAAREPRPTVDVGRSDSGVGAREDWMLRAQRVLGRLTAQAVTRDARRHCAQGAAADDPTLDQQIEQLTREIDAREPHLANENALLVSLAKRHASAATADRATPRMPDWLDR